MKRIVLAITLALLCSLSYGQTAKEVLDKAAATISNKQGITAKFKISGPNFSPTDGTISVKGKKFQASTEVAIIWFDGKTQWTYMKQNNNLYKKGFTYNMVTKGNSYEVHLTATDKKRGVQEMYITVNKTSFVPTQVKMKQKQGWTTINISNFKTAKLSDSMFRFNNKDYPHAEVIDLR